MSSIQRRFNDYENAYLNNIDFPTYNHSQSHSNVTVLSSKMMETSFNTLHTNLNNNFLTEKEEEEEMTDYNTSNNLNYMHYHISSINRIHSPEDSEDENQEIDYPDEEEYEGEYYNDDEENEENEENINTINNHPQNDEVLMDNDDDDDSEHDHHHDHNHDHDNYQLYTTSSYFKSPPSSKADCQICFQSKSVFSHRLDQLDDSPYFTIPRDQVFINPCNKHYTCGECIRQSLLVNSQSVFKQGQGQFPCFDTHGCFNSLGHLTTCFLYQLKDLFDDQEWRTITQTHKNFISSQQLQEKTCQPYFAPLTEEIKVDASMAFQHMVEIMNQDVTRVNCPICCVVIQKTTACYSIRHCDWEVCWMCHKVSRRLDPNHWKTCPRYDHDVFWKNIGYHCEENKCVDENKICLQKSHQLGIEKMNLIRKSYQIFCFFNSLSKPIQQDVTNQLKKEKKLKEFKKYCNLYEENLYNKPIV